MSRPKSSSFAQSSPGQQHHGPLPAKPAAGGGARRRAHGDDTHGPLVWELEFSLGQLYNKGLFLLGYAPEMRHFCECVLESRAPEWDNRNDVIEMLRVYEAYCQPDGRHITLE